LFNSILVGVTIILVLVISGFQQWSFLLSVFMGAAAQTAFRLGKRYYKNKIVEKDRQVERAELVVNDSEEIDIFTIQLLGMIYIAMLFVSALWYGIGVLLRVIIGYFY